MSESKSNISWNQKQCGIYSATNITNGKALYGSSNNVYARTRTHRSLLRRKVHRNQHLQAAHNKYGADAFVWRFELAVHEPFLLWVEQIYIDANPDGYNIARVAVAPMKGRHHTPEAKERIGAASRGKPGRKPTAEENERRRQSRLGTKQTPEAKQKVGNFWRGKKRGPMSDEHREKNRLGHIGIYPSAETRAILSALRKGKQQSKEAIQKRRVTKAKHPTTRGYSQNGQSFRVSCFGQRFTVKTEAEAIAAVAKIRREAAEQ